MGIIAKTLEIAARIWRAGVSELIALSQEEWAARRGYRQGTPVDHALREQQTKHTRTMGALVHLRPVEQIAQQGAAEFGGEVSARAWDVVPPHIVWTIQVDTFKEMEFIVEFLERRNLKCTETRDAPKFQQRIYMFGIQLWVEAYLRPGSKLCEVVVVGYSEPTPIIEFKCS